MNRKQTTDITAIIDRSGSMDSVVEATISGFNTFVAQQRAEPGHVVMTLVQFDDQYQIDYSGVQLDSVPELTTRTYEPRGATALLDAVGRTIVETGQRLAAMPESQRPSKVMMMILTDGYENASRKYTLHQIGDMIRHQQDVYSWQFVFLAANQDAIASAAAFNIGADAALSYAASPTGVDVAFSEVSRKTRDYRRQAGPRAAQFFDKQARDANDEEIRKTGKPADGNGKSK